MFDATQVLAGYQSKWFSTAKPNSVKFNRLLSNAPLWPPLAENQSEVVRVKDMLSYVSADCSYERWRNIVWAVLSTGWSCAEALAMDWSKTAPDRFDENAFWSVANSFDPNGGISLGSLVHYARAGGCIGNNLEAAGLVPSSQAIERYKFKTARQVRDTRPMEWRIKNLLPETGIGAIFGPSGSGKTFLAFDLAASIALGQPFYGRKVVKCPVVYVALEGGAGVAQRIKAWEKQHNQNLPDTFRIMTDALSLLNSDAFGFAEALNDAGLSEGVVIIDTLNQSAPGADENSPADMGKIISNAMVVQRLTKCLVLLVHHTGKDVSKGMRGHSSLVAAMDVTIKVERKVVGREWSIDKLKDGEDDVSYPFKLEVVDLGVDADGDPINSCVAVGDTFRVNKPKPPTGKNQIPVLEAIKSYASGAGSIAYEEGLNAGCDALQGVASKHRKERAVSAIEGLIFGGHLIRNGATLEIV